MQRLEVSSGVRLIYGSLGVKRVNEYWIVNDVEVDTCGILEVLSYHLTARTEQET